MTKVTQRRVTSATMRRLYSRKNGCAMRIARRSVVTGEWGWLLVFDRDWQSGLSCEMKRVPS